MSTALVKPTRELPALLSHGPAARIDRPRAREAVRLFAPRPAFGRRPSVDEPEDLDRWTIEPLSDDLFFAIHEDGTVVLMQDDEAVATWPSADAMDPFYMFVLGLEVARGDSTDTGQRSAP